MGRSADCATATAVLFLVIQGVLGASVKVSQLEVPPHAQRHTNQTLRCQYAVDAGSEVYTLKWYFNDVEFYRYTPQDGSKQVFPNTNIEVIEDESDLEKVVLREVELSASGVYKCEVNMDWPNFVHDEASANMTVVVIPDEILRLEGDTSSHYVVGDQVSLNCSTAPSIPPAALTWFINDKEAPKEYLHEYPHEKVDGGLFVSTLRLSFKVTHEYYVQGLKLKCTGSIATLYHRAVEHSQVTPTDPVIHHLPSEVPLVTANGPGSGSSGVRAWVAVCGGLVLSILLLR